MALSALLSLLAVVACFTLLIVIVSRMLLARRREQSSGHRDCAEDLLAGFDIEKYRPMARLLASEELAFLEAQPGYRPAISRQWKAERRRIFRLYLTELKGDFRALHAQARRLVANAGGDSQDLVTTLMRQRWFFLRATSQLEFRLAMVAIGIGQVDVGPLLELLETMRVDLTRRGLPQAAQS